MRIVVDAFAIIGAWFTLGVVAGAIALLLRRAGWRIR